MTNPDYYKPLPGFNTFIVNNDVHMIVTNGNVKFVSISGGPIKMSEWDFGTAVQKHLAMRVTLRKEMK